MKEYVVLVDEHDNEIGIEEKLVAHEKALLHRAFSIYILSVENKVTYLLLQQRALHKYHGAGLWTNTCCSHPRPNESILDAAARRLQEEMDMHVSLKEIGVFTYLADFPNGLYEHEIDHVLIGYQNRETLVAPNPNEVMATRWIAWDDALQEAEQHPEAFTPWFLQGMDCISSARARDPELL